MALATVADVQRVLGNPVGLGDDTLVEPLKVAESYLRPQLPRWDDEVGGTEVYYNVRGSDEVVLPVPGAAITAVRLYDAASSSPAVVPATDYATQDGRFVPLRSWASQTRRWYAKVEVDWTNTSGDVPEAVRDAVALTAAAIFRQFPKVTSGMRSERIGDYSYTLADKDVDEIMPTKARLLLKPFLRRRTGVFVT